MRENNNSSIKKAKRNPSPMKKRTFVKKKQNEKLEITYDASIGVITIIDKSDIAKHRPSVSPMYISKTMSQNIKKLVLAKIV